MQDLLYASGVVEPEIQIALLVVMLSGLCASFVFKYLGAKDPIWKATMFALVSTLPLGVLLFLSSFICPGPLFNEGMSFGGCFDGYQRVSGIYYIAASFVTYPLVLVILIVKAVLGARDSA